MRLCNWDQAINRCGVRLYNWDQVIDKCGVNLYNWEYVYCYAHMWTHRYKQQNTKAKNFKNILK